MVGDGTSDGVADQTRNDRLPDDDARHAQVAHAQGLERPVFLQAFDGGRVHRLTDDDDIRSVLSVPLRRGDRVRGLLVLVHHEPGHFDDDHLSFLASVADQAAIAVENAFLLEQSQQRIKELALINEISQVASSLHLNDVLRIVTQRIVEARGQHASGEPASTKEHFREQLPAVLGGADDGVAIHSVRGAGYLAEQEVRFSLPGESLTIEHRSIDRRCFMPGIVYAIRNISRVRGLMIGLDALLEL